MYEVSLTVSENRFQSVVRRRWPALLGRAPEDVDTLSHEEISRILGELVAWVLSDELAWLDERQITCKIRLTDSLKSFILIFEKASDALLFESVWGGEALYFAAASDRIQ